jgi:Alw26I/Eco31I/Esp3I family type II restriction endonuclease
MPDAFYEQDQIQWEAPSNRATGKFRDTHQRRREWWINKALSIGIRTDEAHWISRTAKSIHPTGEKPCKACGQVLRIGYVYPSQFLLARIRRIPFIASSFDLSPLEPIDLLVKRLVDAYGTAAIESLPRLLQAKATTARSLPGANLAEWLRWIGEVYVPSEPASLSPGVMSNAPDRFDGFHSFNRCCRGKADEGRLNRNMKTYVTDRRVFEYWAEGDWISANDLMGQLRANYPDQSCRHGHPGPCQADHIGPISLGFTHRPKFQLLCRMCNSSKNNRMWLSDVVTLRDDEARGETVISWHSSNLWNLCRDKVDSDEKALRISKLLRDNRHSLMYALKTLADRGHFAFLATLLDLDYANREIAFDAVNIVDHLASFSGLRHKPRRSEYAGEQKARRCRIAFDELFVYFQKKNRNEFVVESDLSRRFLNNAVRELAAQSRQAQVLDGMIAEVMELELPADRDIRFRALAPKIEETTVLQFGRARQELQAHMDKVGGLLADSWDHLRYVRNFPLLIRSGG